jgi:CubicO group peptidase (beta-lactamase class C family)
MNDNTDQNTRQKQSDLHGRLQVAAQQARLASPALSYAVATTHGVITAGAVGTSDLALRRPASPEDTYPWFSMTKIATATAVVRLADQGDLDLDAELGEYLDRYDRSNPGNPTVRQLLTHTAGLGNPLPIRWVRPEAQPANSELLAAIASMDSRSEAPALAPPIPTSVTSSPVRCSRR